MNNKEFEEELLKLGIKLTNEQTSKLEKFYNILVEENKKINLTRIIEKKDIYLKHFYDSLTITKVVNLEETNTLCDVGTGAGFPGIVLKIVYPNLNVILIDSLLKRVNYLNQTIEKLNLKNIKAIHTRSEDYKGEFDVVTSRAVASLEKLVPYCIHLVNKKGKMIAMKANITDEIEKSKTILEKYNCKIENKVEFLLPEEKSKRTLLVITKNK